MTSLWRIVTPPFVAGALSGEGAHHYPGRWNIRGVRMVYAATSSALAILEFIANAEPIYEPEEVVLLRLSCNPEIKPVDESRLPRNWREMPAPVSTREFGVAWVTARTSVAIGVPSVVLPTSDDYNVLLNPLHADMRQIKVSQTIVFRPDERLIPQT